MLSHLYWLYENLPETLNEVFREFDWLSSHHAMSNKHNRPQPVSRLLL